MIEIEISRGSRPGRYAVRLLGEVLVEAARDPENQACRILLSRGITGQLAARWAGSPVVASTRDIASAAGWSVEDGHRGLRRVPWRPFPARCDAASGRELQPTHA